VAARGERDSSRSTRRGGVDGRGNCGLPRRWCGVILPLLVLQVEVQSTGPFLALTAVGQIGFLLVGYVYARYSGLVVNVSRPSLGEIRAALAGVLAALVVVTGTSVVFAIL